MRLIVLIALVACSGRTKSRDDAAVATATAIATDRITCPYGVDGTGSGVTYDKRCASDADCAVGFHLLDCCGSVIALGVARDEAARFARLDVCGSTATCKCAGRGILAEDGHRTADDEVYLHGSVPRDVVTACANGRCRTRVDASWVAPARLPDASLPDASIDAPGRQALPTFDCPAPSPADCTARHADCMPTACACRSGAWACTPDCGGCQPQRLAPVTSPR